jgi:hypothetical protein|nr:MAG TPA: hypothetical protein [Caudoviricetes sp.]
MKTWNKNTIDLKEYLEKDIVIHCDNEEKSNDLLEYLDKQGIKWASGSRLTEKNYYCIYEGVICYNYEFDGISCSDTHMYESNGYDIVKWEIVDKNQQKNNISWDKFVNENVVIHCKSEKETEELLCWILQNKKEMSISPIIAFANGWKEYRGDICFEFSSNNNAIYYADKKFYNSQHCEVVEWNNKNIYTINGTIEVDIDIDTLNDKFIEFIESINGEFGGGIK